MKTSPTHLTIGDLHGRNCWEFAAREWLARSPVNFVVFLGDYVDSFDVSLAQQADNLRNVIAFKQEHPTRVALLWGNHDVHYMWPDAPRGSGFKPINHAQLFPIFNEHRTLFQVAYEVHGDGQKYLWTHAGISDAWATEMPPITFPYAELRQARISDVLNCMTESREHRQLLFQVGAARGGMSNGGPLWADMKELLRGPFAGFHQIVGHTALKQPGHARAHTTSDPNSSVTFCDYNEFTLGIENVRPDFFYQV